MRLRNERYAVALTHCARETMRYLIVSKRLTTAPNGEIQQSDAEISAAVEAYRKESKLVRGGIFGIDADADSLFGDLQPPPISVKIMKITPKIAQQMLEKNTRNRPLSQHVVSRYATDMREGRWGVSESAICFDVNGLQINGQHRLWAVFESGVSIYSIIAEGYPVGAINYLDDQHHRSALSVYKLTHNDEDSTPSHMAIARVFDGGGQELAGNKSSRQKVFAQLDKHKAAIDFAVNALRPRRQSITVSPVYAVIARAFYSVDHAQLAKFCDVLISGGYVTDVEKSILLLRDLLLRTKSSDRAIRVDRYKRTERSLIGFIRGEVMRKLYPANEELFFVPGDADYRGKVS